MNEFTVCGDSVRFTELWKIGFLTSLPIRLIKYNQSYLKVVGTSSPAELDHNLKTTEFLKP